MFIHFDKLLVGSQRVSASSQALCSFRLLPHLHHLQALPHSQGTTSSSSSDSLLFPGSHRSQRQDLRFDGDGCRLHRLDHIPCSEFAAPDPRCLEMVLCGQGYHHGGGNRLGSAEAELRLSPAWFGIPFAPIPDPYPGCNQTAGKHVLAAHRACCCFSWRALEPRYSSLTRYIPQLVVPRPVFASQSSALSTEPDDIQRECLCWHSLRALRIPAVSTGPTASPGDGPAMDPDSLASPWDGVLDPVLAIRSPVALSLANISPVLTSSCRLASLLC